MISLWLHKTPFCIKFLVSYLVSLSLWIPIHKLWAIITLYSISRECFFILWWTLGWFHNLAIVSRVTIDIGVLKQLYTQQTLTSSLPFFFFFLSLSLFLFFSVFFLRQILEMCRSSVFSSVRNSHTEFPNGNNNLHPHQQCRNVFPPFPTPSSPAFIVFFLL